MRDVLRYLLLISSSSSQRARTLRGGASSDSFSVNSALSGASALILLPSFDSHAGFPLQFASAILLPVDRCPLITDHLFSQWSCDMPAMLCAGFAARRSAAIFASSAATK